MSWQISALLEIYDRPTNLPTEGHTWLQVIRAQGSCYVGQCTENVICRDCFVSKKNKLHLKKRRSSNGNFEYNFNIMSFA